MNVETDFSIMILAAGKSSRLGQAKQLLKYKGKSLLQNTIEACTALGANDTVVILGANSELIEEKLDLSNVIVLKNEEYERGLASSITKGVQYLREKTSAILILVCDQAHINSNQLKGIIKAWKNNPSKIICSTYVGTLGVPAIFPSDFFEDLTQLKQDKGAKSLLINYQDKLISLPFEGGEVDIDTEQDYNDLLPH
ncbi:nucleotidyltransferase family protein [Echinicola shivajiensis]|uniref:nucleotidyltransferase family protein n=1 Tax=Echinicola shivajiensis TaxID=1035916 RepID=UPI001BFC0056|nr:nucleotidyltransferase family protein [Echinicola shivajiensis]